MASTAADFCFLLVLGCVWRGTSSCLNAVSDVTQLSENDTVSLTCSVCDEMNSTQRWVAPDNTTVSEGCNLRNQSESGGSGYSLNCTEDTNGTRLYTLTITRALVEVHSGMWCCQVEDDQLPPSCLLINASVIADKPVWTPDVYLESQPANLTCSTNADASPTPSFTWWMSTEVDGSDTSPLDGDSHDWNDASLLYNTLTFLPNRTHHGVYVWCQVDQDFLNAPLRSDNHTISIMFTPEYTGDDTIASPLEIMNTDDSLLIPCQYTAFPAAILTWTAPSTYLSTAQTGVTDDVSNLTVSTSNLTWRNEVHPDARKYGSGYVTCLAENAAGNASRTIQIDVHYGPSTPDLLLENSTVYPGDYINMHCLFSSGLNGTDGNPGVSVFNWYFNNSTISSDVIGNTSILASSVKQEGLYSCSGTNHPVAGNLTGPRSDPVNVTIFVLPYIIEPQEPGNTTVLYNDTTSILDCLVSGKPEVEVKWFKDAVLIDAGLYVTSHVSEAGNYSYAVEDGWRSYVNMSVDIAGLTCENITQFDGQYQCQASHTDKTSQLSPPIALTTLYPAHWAGTRSRNYSRELAHNITLHCDVCMEPAGSFAWSYNGAPINDEDGIVVDRQNITIDSIQLTDYGIYTCEVTNEIKGQNYSQRFDIELNLKPGPPWTPSYFSVSSKTSFSVSLTWRVGFNGGLDQTFTLLYRSSNSEEWMQKPGIMDTGHIIDETLTDLKNNAEYEILLFAVNTHTELNQSNEAILRETTLETPEVEIVHVMLTERSVQLNYTILQGRPSSLSLLHQVNSTFPDLLLSDIPLDNRQVHFSYPDSAVDVFDVHINNTFVLWVHELGRQEAIAKANITVTPLPDEGARVWVIVVGVVIALVALCGVIIIAFFLVRRGKKDNTDRTSDEQTNALPSRHAVMFPDGRTSAEYRKERCPGQDTEEIEDDDYDRASYVNFATSYLNLSAATREPITKAEYDNLITEPKTQTSDYEAGYANTGSYSSPHIAEENPSHQPEYINNSEYFQQDTSNTDNVDTSHAVSHIDGKMSDAPVMGASFGVPTVCSSTDSDTRHATAPLVIISGVKSQKTQYENVCIEDPSPNSHSDKHEPHMLKSLDEKVNPLAQIMLQMTSQIQQKKNIATAIENPHPIIAKPKKEISTVDDNPPPAIAKPEKEISTAGENPPHILVKPKKDIFTVNKNQPPIIAKPKKVISTVDTKQPPITTKPKKEISTVDKNPPSITAEPKKDISTVAKNPPPIIAKPKMNISTVDKNPPPIIAKPKMNISTVDKNPPPIIAKPKMNISTVDKNPPPIIAKPKK